MTPQQVSGLWDLLGQTWGAKFLDQYGTAPNDAWTAALAQVTVDAARHAVRRLIREGSGFAPTLPEFIAAAGDYRPESMRQVLPNSGAPVSTATLRASASFAGEFNEYRDYERWRSENTHKGNKPPHPTVGSPDWEYLHRLALADAARQNARAGSEQAWGV